MKNILKSAACVAALMIGANNASAEIDNDLLSGIKARVIGPAAMSGRVAAIDAVVSDPNHIVVGAATGGVWISKNGGLNWTPTFDGEECASIGSVAINQSNPDIIWVGTGEGNTRNSTSIGCGMFKSLDGGKTWNKVGLEDSERINSIALDPTNPDVAYAAVLGKLWGDSDDRGLYKTTDGGETWNIVLAGDETTGATDVQMDPSNPNKLFASMWQFRRWPFFFKSGGPGSGLFVSHDGGENWKQLTEEDGLPKGELGRSAFTISRSNPNRVYALIEAKESALSRSDDGGRTWTSVNTDTDINDRPFYYNGISVDPQNPDRVYRVGSRVKMSIDGGKTFSFVDKINCCAPRNDIHIDNHAWWINPNNSKHIIDGNDGGLGITQDGGDTWRFVANLPLAQFYHIAVDNDLPYNVYGGLQDNGAWRGPSQVFENGGIRNLHWQEVAFGDGFDTIPDPTNSRRGISMSQGGFLVSWNLDTGEQRLIRPKGPEDGTELRFNWNAGFGQSPFDSNTIYYGSQFVHKSTDRGLTWEIISDDLTTNNPEFQTFRESGGITPDVTAAENYTSITSINPSPVDENVIWVGTDDGRVHVTRDGGTTWNSVEDNIRRGPDRGWVPMIEPSRYDASIAFIAVDDHRRGDNKPYFYRMENYGERWRSIVTDDLTGYALSIRQDHKDENLLFAGTEFGLHFSTNGGREWTKWAEDVPTVSVMDIAIQERENDLVLGTHGRSAYVIDDYSALRGMNDDTFSEPLKILSITDGQQYIASQTPSTRFPGDGEFRADNEPYGAMITFVASGDDIPHADFEQEKARKIAMRAATAEEDSEEKSAKKATDRVTVKISDSSGNVIRTFKSDIVKGVNRIVWNMRQDGVQAAPPAQPRKDGTLPAGIEVLPGNYSVTLEYGDITDNSDLRVLADPRSQFTVEQQRVNYNTRAKLSALQAQIQKALTQVMNARRDVDTLMTLIKSNNSEESDAYKDLSKQASDVKKAFEEMEKRFRIPLGTRGIVFRGGNVSAILGTANAYVGSTRDVPNEAARQQIARAEAAITEAVDATNKLISDDLAALRSAVDEAGIGLFNQTEITEVGEE
ncbi:VPS10 domain-containing protein [Kordiimonas aquimaris]|uniref:VPS10 domain-containing protein n=1 Tax=Kordiimonas aquimaris TaxID=707591 RepID=UPI0021CF9CC1|nr:hypothetical protein [Kordiimonas aquimaris]